MSSVTPLDSAPEKPAAPDLDAPELYLNRELTWLAFNRRVLAEAENEQTPLLERVKFLSIFDSNLDEFFMKRIGGLKQQLGAGLTTLTVDGRTPEQQLEQCRAHIVDVLADRAIIKRDILDALADEGIRVESYESLDEKRRAKIRKRYKSAVLPLVTPLAIDEAHPFPFISNLSINLLVEVHDPAEATPHHVRIKVPTSTRTPRFMAVGSGDRFVLLEDVISNNLDLLFPGADILSVGYFRVTRNAIVERDEELANDLLEMIEAELRDRRFAPVVRLEVSPGTSKAMRDYLVRELRFSGPQDVYETADMLGLRDVMQIAELDRPALKYLPFEPAPHSRLSGRRSIFAELDENGPILLKHPYQSFDDSVTRLLREAARDPSVLAIKTTVYRTGEKSEIIPLLIDAVSAGKQVAVVVELQARFDEAANIRWANRLEEAGIHVSYGVVGYKTHAKSLLILRQKPNGKLRRYVHVGTGNYHSGTARQYCDVGLLISDARIGADTTQLFNLLTSGSLSGRNYKSLLVAPMAMKQALLAKIDREIRSHHKHGNGRIQLKTNALEDPEVTRALYKASLAGVTIDLIVRDSCRLRPGVPGLSETIRVISILGRFLEHSRIYYFHNNGGNEYYIGSADLMTRNLEARVEVLAPVDDDALKAELRQLLDLQLADTHGAWEMNPDGSYRKRTPEDGSKHSQTSMMEAAYEDASRSRGDSSGTFPTLG